MTASRFRYSNAPAPLPVETGVGEDPQRSWIAALPSDLLSCLVIGLVLTFIIAPWDGLAAWLQYLLVTTIISTSIGMSLTVVLRSSRSLYERIESPLGRIAGYGALGAVGTLIGAEIGVQIVRLTGPMQPSDFRFGVYRIGFAVAATALAVRITYDRLRDRARRDELSAEEAKREALQARLKELQARTNPHFLFNSLNTAASLIDEDPELAEQTLEGLSEIFRYTLKGSQVEWVRVSEELEAVTAYLEVEALRLGERLRFDIDVADDLAERWIPPLVLSPLVENAVLHGVAPQRKGGRIRVAAEVIEDRLFFSVTDDGPGPGGSLHRGSGTSLADLEKRLGLVYRGDASLEIAPVSARGGCRVTLSLPSASTMERSMTTPESRSERGIDAGKSREGGTA